MARRRITEADLLEYRVRADELKQQLEIKYEEIERSKKTQQELEHRDVGLLILCSGDVDMAVMRKFNTAVWNAGFSPELVDISINVVDHDPKVRIPEWQKSLDKAQFGYLKLSERVKQLVVLGVGRAAAAATVLTEQYPVDGLVIVGEGPAVKTFCRDRAVAKTAYIAKNNLFSIVCPVYVIAPGVPGDYKAGSCRMFEQLSRSEDVRIDEMPGLSVAQIWTEREQDMENRIFGFLREFSD